MTSRNKTLEELKAFGILGGAGIRVCTSPRKGEERCRAGGGETGKNVPDREKVRCKDMAGMRR